MTGTSRTIRPRGNTGGNTGTICPAAGTLARSVPAAGIVPVVTPAGTSRTIRRTIHPRGGNRPRGNTDGNTRSVVPAPATPFPTPRHTADHCLLSSHSPDPPAGNARPYSRTNAQLAPGDHLLARQSETTGRAGATIRTTFPGTIRPFTRTAGTMRPFTRTSPAPTTGTHRGHTPRAQSTIFSRDRTPRQSDHLITPQVDGDQRTARTGRQRTKRRSSRTRNTERTAPDFFTHRRTTGDRATIFSNRRSTETAGLTVTTIEPKVLVVAQRPTDDTFAPRHCNDHETIFRADRTTRPDCVQRDGETISSTKGTAETTRRRSLGLGEQ